MHDFAIRDLTQKEKDTLEALIDSASLSSVLLALSVICRKKADHIKYPWQDDYAGHAWSTTKDSLVASAELISLVE